MDYFNKCGDRYANFVLKFYIVQCGYLSFYCIIAQENVITWENLIFKDVSGHVARVIDSSSPFTSETIGGQIFQLLPGTIIASSKEEQNIGNISGCIDCYADRNIFPCIGRFSLIGDSQHTPRSKNFVLLSRTIEARLILIEDASGIREDLKEDGVSAEPDLSVHKPFHNHLLGWCPSGSAQTHGSPARQTMTINKRLNKIFVWPIFVPLLDCSLWVDLGHSIETLLN